VPQSLCGIGYAYNEKTDKWTISDAAADYIFTGKEELSFALPGTLKVITDKKHWETALDKTKYFPLFFVEEYFSADEKSGLLNFVSIDCFNEEKPDADLFYLVKFSEDATVVLCLKSTNKNAMQSIRRLYMELEKRKIKTPTIIVVNSSWQTADEHLIHYSTEAGALLLDGFGNGIFFGMSQHAYNNFIKIENQKVAEQFINSTAFSILQATRKRISKTEYISCPSCGRTLFDLQETTAKIRSMTHHLKGVKIAIMGCIVNGPGEMADADFGYVGSGVGKITLYKGKEIVKRNVDSAIAVDELINLLKENDAWVEAIKN
jgi:(E)-4-hydroxy-3-methylbut-2-enyl-diphosphate synthase